MVVYVSWDRGFVFTSTYPVGYVNSYIKSVEVSEPWHLGENTFVVSTGSDTLGVYVFLQNNFTRSVDLLEGERLGVGEYRFTADLNYGDVVVLRLPGDYLYESMSESRVTSDDVARITAFLAEYESAVSAGVSLLNVLDQYDVNRDGVFDILDVEYIQNLADTGIYPW